MTQKALPPSANTCPKCQGLLLHNSDLYGPYLSCTRCGLLIDLVLAQAAPPDPSHPEHGRAITVQTPKDTGCNESPSCQKCPLPSCKHDDRRAYASLIRQRQMDDQALKNTFTSQPQGAPEVLTVSIQPHQPTMGAEPRITPASTI